MSLLLSSWPGPHESHDGLYTDKERNNDPQYWVRHVRLLIDENEISVRYKMKAGSLELVALIQPVLTRERFKSFADVEKLKGRMSILYGKTKHLTYLYENQTVS